MSLSSPLTYTTSRGEVFPLDTAGIRRYGEDELRGHEWSRELHARSASGIAAEAREVDVAVAGSREAIDALRRAMDADTAAGSPGTLEVAGWSQRALLVESAPDTLRGSYAATLTVALLDGYWKRPRSADFMASGREGGAWLDLPCDLPCDLGLSSALTELETGLAQDADVKLLVFGPAVNPSVTIGGNRYALDAIVPEGAHIEVDGTTWPRTIQLVGIDGQRTDMFGAGHRATGAGSGEYIFEPLHPSQTGWLPVEWDGTFGFQLIWHERDSEPPWGGGPWT